MARRSARASRGEVIKSKASAFLDLQSGVTQSKKWYEWLKEGQFYIYGLVYASARVALNSTMMLQPLYLTKVTKYLPTEDLPTPIPLATVPMFSYIIGMAYSILLQRKLTEKLKNRMWMMALSVVAASVSSIPMAFLNQNSQNAVYPLAALQGIAIALMLNTGTSLISDMIGQDTANSSVVYGFYSLFDKALNGVIVFFFVEAYSDNELALRYIMSVLPTCCSILCFVLAVIGNKFFSDKMAELSEGDGSSVQMSEKGKGTDVAINK